MSYDKRLEFDPRDPKRSAARAREAKQVRRMSEKGADRAILDAAEKQGHTVDVREGGILLTNPTTQTGTIDRAEVERASGLDPGHIKELRERQERDHRR